MFVLPIGQREKLLKMLQHATDSQLARFGQQMVEDQERMRASMEYVSKNPMFGGAPVKIDPPIKQEAKPEQEVRSRVEAVLNDTKPPGKAAKKIGKETTELILERLVKPHTIDEINGALRRPDSRLDDTQALMALLWQRKLVTYDGEMYRKA